MHLDLPCETSAILLLCWCLEQGPWPNKLAAEYRQQFYRLRACNGTWLAVMSGRGPSELRPFKRLPPPAVQLPLFHLVHDAIFSPGGMPVGAAVGPHDDDAVPDAGKHVPEQYTFMSAKAGTAA